MVDVILHNNDAISTFGDYIRGCKRVLSNYLNISVYFVRYNVNALVYNFATISRNHESSTLWNDPPFDVDELPANNCTCEHII